MIYLKVTNLAPLHLADGHTVGQMAQTLPYIPGRALRGALARQWEAQYGVGEPFDRLFLSPHNWYGPLLPLSPAADHETFVLPQTAFTCKSFPGFRSRAARDRHGVQDRLFTLLLDPKTDSDDQCATCQSALQPVSQPLYARRDSSYLTVEPDKRLITRTALDSRREAAARQQLFTQEVIGEGQQFAGFIELANKDDEALLLEQGLGQGVRFWVGAAKTRGQGEVEVKQAATDLPSELQPLRQPLSERLTSLNDRARQAGVAADYQTVFTLDLLSDAIIRDDYLRFARHVTPAYLGHYLHPDLAQAELLASFCQTRLVDGWQRSQGLPRETAVVITAGSVFVFGSDLAADDLAERLAPLERWGIGGYQAEGLGQVTINHPFHLVEEAV